ncbi:DUF2461 domain-containing protein [Quadrisphaera sp. KR29]|uniref:DUF2461 domain-containing protein n=1 Tax=Quadrisphaera sp. KR29 TaxID=3461391 RepID=UPI004043A6E7
MTGAGAPDREHGGAGGRAGGRAVGRAVGRVGTSFSGFGPDLVALYEGLAADNGRAYWQAHRRVYEEQVRGPLEALAADLAPVFGEVKVFRPNRDVRFSPDKRPYQEHAAMVVSAAAGTALYFQVSAEELLVAAGLYAPTPDQLQRFRRAVDAGPPAAELDRVVAGAEQEAGLRLSAGDPLKTAPRGYPRDHPRIDLLRLRSLTVGRSWEPARWWQTSAVRDRVVAAWTAAGPLNAWCDRHVGPPDHPRERAADRGGRRGR